MKRLEKFLRPYRRESILAPLFKLLEVVFDLMVPVVVAQIIDVGVAKNDRGYIVEMFFVLLLMAAVGLLCSFTAQFFAKRQVSDLRPVSDRQCSTISRDCHLQNWIRSERIR